MGERRLQFLGTQRYLIDEVAKGLNQGVHHFIVLKARQLGITTVSLALTLYWLFGHKGLQGALVTDTDENRVKFRTNISQYITSLPKGWRLTPTEHNRAQLVLPNRSRLSYMVAGTKKKGDLGKGSAVNYLHATECASWGDEDGLASLMATLAQQHPHRFYLFESTANGYNMWNQMWEDAKNSTSIRPIFISWWRNELYQLQESDPRYKNYWDGAPTSDEKVWLAEVFELYGVNINARQIAWWRWMLAEEMKEEAVMLENYPPTEHYAFQLTGSKFFSTERVNMMYKRATQQQRKFYRYQFGIHFEQTQFLDTNEENGDLSIWEHPDPRGVYILGADPAYGSSEWADQFAICVLRCFSDRVVQVAEYKSADLTEQQFAWVMCHLAASYRPCMVNLEMQGPGGTVFNELQNLKRYAGTPTGPLRDWYNVKESIRDYFWRKPDGISGHPSAYQWQTNAKEKTRMMTTLRSYFERDMIHVNSPECAAQFRNIHREGDVIGGEGRAKDDMVIALGIAVIAWEDWIKREMEAENRTYYRETRPEEAQRNMHPAETAVLKFLAQQGIKLAH